MKCFACGANCVTEYIYHHRIFSKIVAVQKNCTECEWHSHPTKIPESI